MSEPEGALEGALHEHDADPEPHVRAWRGRAGDSLTEPGATIIDITLRNRDRIAERWGKPIVEPLPDPPAEPGDTTIRLRDALNAVPSWSSSPSLQAIWFDLAEGGRKVHEDSGLVLAAGYWAVGIPGYLIAAVCEQGKLTASRPGRACAAAVIVLLLWGALAVAGLNPVPISDLNPFQ